MAKLIDITEQALERIGIKALDREAEAMDKEKAREVLINLHELFVDLKYVRFELDNIPGQYVGSLVSELSYALKDEYSLPESTRARLELSQREARRDIMAMSAIPYDGGPLEAEYF